MRSPPDVSLAAWGRLGCVRTRVSYRGAVRSGGESLDRALRPFADRERVGGTICGTNWEGSMSITASQARKTLFPLIEQVNDDRAPVEITSKRGNAVLISADDFAAWQETAYLFRSPANARRLLDALEAVESGEAVERGLDRS